MSSLPTDCLGAGRGDQVAHRQLCADCRIAHQLREDFEGSAGPEPGDELLLARIVERAPRQVVVRRTRVPRTVAVAAALVLFAAGIASGALFTRLGFEQDEERAEGHAKSHRKGKRSDVRSAHDRAQTEGEPEPEKTQEPEPQRQDEARPAEAPPNPTLSAAPAPVVAPSPARSRLSKRIALTPSRPRLGAPAAEAPLGHSAANAEAPLGGQSHALFRRALEARQRGRRDEAIAAFRSLEAEFPGTQEAQVSYLSLGGLLLEAGQREDALAAFDAYLAQAPGGPLVPEALAGRARALLAAGRDVESARVWRELVSRFPDSPYARRRIDLPAAR